METDHDDDVSIRTDTTLPSGLVPLETAAERLGVSRQGIVSLLERSGIGIRRVRDDGRTISAVDELDLERLRPSSYAAPQSAGQPLLARLQGDGALHDLQLAETREKLRRTHAELAEVRADLKLAERSIEQLERAGREAGEAQSQIVELTRTLGGLEANLQSARAEIVRRDEELAFLREQFREERARLSSEAEAERRRWAMARQDLEGTREIKDALARQLKLAQQVEAANHLYLDRVEEKLSAARHAAEFLRRKGA
jgi:biotin operon repressor